MGPRRTAKSEVGRLSTYVLIEPDHLRKAARSYRSAATTLLGAQAALERGISPALPNDLATLAKDTFHRAVADIREQITYVGQEAISLDERATLAKQANRLPAKLAELDAPGQGGAPELGERFGQRMRPNLDQIMREYQVNDDDMREWLPTEGVIWNYHNPLDKADFDSELLTNREIELLKALSALETIAFWQIRRQADAMDGDNVGPGNAAKHAYWSALLSRRFGEKWAREFTTAHEGRPDSDLHEAMDMYNNEVGRKIAKDNPNASEARLRALILDAIKRGELVVVDGKRLNWSDRVPLSDAFNPFPDSPVPSQVGPGYPASPPPGAPGPSGGSGSRPSGGSGYPANPGPPPGSR